MTTQSGGNSANAAETAASKSDVAANKEQRVQPPLVVQAQYVKDLSFEAPATPQVFAQLQQGKPDIRVNCDVQTKAAGGAVHEVILHLRADCRVGETVAFVVELSYGGLFQLNVPAEHVNPVLLIECPRLLFPFARQILAATTLDGGFLPLMLGPIDFASLYQRQLQDRRKDSPEPVGKSQPISDTDSDGDIKLA